MKTFFSYHKALMQLLHSAGFSALSQRTKLEALLTLCGDLLKTDSVSIWSMSSCGASLNREFYYQPQSGHHYLPYTLTRAEHALYFKVLEEAEILVTHDATQDPRTQSLRGTYVGHGSDVAAMLDVPIYDGNRLYGVLCLESAAQRHWSLPDIACATAFADTVSLTNTHQAWLNSRKELDYITHHDDFTGLQNRHSLEHRLQQLIQKDVPNHFALLWFDIDRLNTINNGLGDQVGDAVVSEVAARLRGLLLPGKDMVARVGGDEFAMLYAWPDDDSELAATVASIMDTLHQPIYIGQQKLVVTTSVGVALYPRDTDDINSLLRCSESAMYHAKACGRRQAQFYNQAVSVSAKARFLLESQLIDALANNGLSVFYQPIMSADLQTLVSCEALVRWSHPRAGFLSPAEFLPLAYEAGLMTELDLWVLERVCQDIKQARTQGLCMPTVAVNLSADTVMDPLLADKVFNLLEHYQIQGGQLELEMIEDAIKGDSSTLSDTLAQLVRMGIKLSIDDFGTGYSSLLRLKNLPFTKLKIDRSFIQDLPHDIDDCALTLSILGMARGLGLAVVAEGVENIDQEQWLQQQGCHYLQGFKYHRPMPVSDFFALLKAGMTHE
ncbi:putative bifunctional diguanylate cyclase/phosphodiesterase [Oceanisphaera sp. W20_SRM_FM3]|uniref:putative bifunctional diguanylate cyclase/phosphodiesterase n=1 Tax=Oceanisphaera sp. W20_SRM_FM3 TaxID=3240267 RepID=UPI003F943B73